MFLQLSGVRSLSNISSDGAPYVSITLVVSGKKSAWLSKYLIKIGNWLSKFGVVRLEDVFPNRKNFLLGMMDLLIFINTKDLLDLSDECT